MIPRSGKATVAGRVPTRWEGRGALLAAALWIAFSPHEGAAHGFHNAALATNSLQQWLSQVKRAVPTLDERRLGESALKSGRDVQALKDRAAGADAARGSPAFQRRAAIQSQMDARQQALRAMVASQCLELLAYLDRRNIYPEEFPTFALQRIPDYRRAAKEVLRTMGPDGSKMVAQQVQTELVAGNRGVVSDMTFHPQYYDDLVDCLQAGVDADQLSEEQLAALQQATQGQKATPQQAVLAKRVQEVVEAGLLPGTDLGTLVRKTAEPSSPGLRRRLAARLSQRIKEAAVPELVAAAGEAGARDVKKRILDELRSRIPSMSTLDLLKLGAAADEPEIQRLAVREAKARKPKYGQVERDLAAIWELARSGKTEVAEAARHQMALAFQQAPLSHCLHWLGQEDGELAAVVWKQLEGRIERAGESGRSGYRDVALAVTKHGEYKIASRQAALRLLARLEDPRAIGPIVEYLPQMPRELWPEAGRTLHALAREDFGPRAGDGIGQVLAAERRWQEWLREKGKK